MRQRSSYPKSFKAQVVQECLQPGATISGVAISHGQLLILKDAPALSVGSRNDSHRRHLARH
ncbi:transposase [Pseudomonas sp. W5-36]|uniref:transposase n=1 Tax=Pseudomonas sp. W5-36 TaxID=3097455 RepID=UPI00397D2D35